MKVKSKLTGQIADGCYTSIQLFNEETGKPLTNKEAVFEVAKRVKKAGLNIIGGKKKGKVIELTISGDTISTDWWTKDIGELFCSLCNKKDTKECNKMTCEVANPWCG
jgi:hypothetical protein